ncbi:YopX family protein [Parageobacillus galactosidasius]|uniref:YopX protein domain-containing protein n=1 Tax=Parageobacillus galactosidasius TaxID=883812 RepID=A0A226QTI5_9BACL|nr:YopX family protein [Parageobacillus galactosidasius]OXB94812.1 hypothetical protein B9L23_08090 [Parageobacillus galactosidasius]
MYVFKVRAWTGEKMIYSDKDTYPLNSYKFEFDWKKCTGLRLFTFQRRIQVTDEDGDTYTIPDWIEVEDAIITQFTGLFDDTGKEIYEGDIVEVTEFKSYPYRAVVHFNYLGAWIKGPSLRKLLGISEIQQLYEYCDYGFGKGILSTCKVIGNIFENPDLIPDEEKNTSK